MKDKKDKDIYLWTTAMINPDTGCIEISAPEARTDLIANQLKLAWLTRYPLYIKIIVDRH